MRSTALLRVTLLVMWHDEVASVWSCSLLFCCTPQASTPTDLAGDGHDARTESSLGVLATEVDPRVANLIRTVTTSARRLATAEGRDVHAR